MAIGGTSRKCAILFFYVFPRSSGTEVIPNSKTCRRRKFKWCGVRRCVCGDLRETLTLELVGNSSPYLFSLYPHVVANGTRSGVHSRIYQPQVVGVSCWSSSSLLFLHWNDSSRRWVSHTSTQTHIVRLKRVIGLLCSTGMSGTNHSAPHGSPNHTSTTATTTTTTTTAPPTYYTAYGGGAGNPPPSFADGFPHSHTGPPPSRVYHGTGSPETGSPAPHQPPPSQQPSYHHHHRSPWKGYPWGGSSAESVPVNASSATTTNSTTNTTTGAPPPYAIGSGGSGNHTHHNATTAGSTGYRHSYVGPPLPPAHASYWGPPRSTSDLLAGGASVANDGREGATSPSQIETDHLEFVQAVGCTCKKTRCLKLYCQCFGVKIYCGPNCRCLDCHNVPAQEDARQNAMKVILSRNPHAFDTKFQKTPVDGATVETPSKLLTHKLGCKCRKSACMKKVPKPNNTAGR